MAVTLNTDLQPLMFSSQVPDISITVSDGNVPDAFNILYNPDIPTPSPDVSGVEPIIQTIEADGTHRYFDLLGRPFNHKPEQGIYIDNGKKILVK